MLLARPVRLTLLAVVATVGALVVAPAAPAAAEGGSYLQIIDATFPTDPRVTFSDTYDACRSGCARVHMATDLMGERMWPLYAMVEGEICDLDEGAEDSWGRHITVCGDDGRRYRYLHLNNDTPGTDDGAAALEHVYAPGIRRGVPVARGQHIAYMGDSGNAEGTASHLHLDIFDDTVTDPYGENRINPYPTLIDALERGDLADGSAFFADRADRVAGEDRVATTIALARTRFEAADAVLLAPWDTPGEAIVAGPLAYALDAPVMMTGRGALDPRVRDEIARLGASRVLLIGDLLDGLEIDDVEVVRIGDADLFATAAAVADEVWAVQGAGDPLEHSPEGDPADVRELPAAEDDLHVSVGGDRADPHHLDTSTVSGDVRIFLAPGDGAVDEVRFHLDDPDLEAEPYHVEGRAPYDLEGANGAVANPFDTALLGDGGHTVTAVVVRGADLTVVSAAFTVANASPPDGGIAATPVQRRQLAPRLEVSDRPDRADPVLLDGARVAGDVYVTVAGPTDDDTDGVAFYLGDPDTAGEPIHTETGAPWDLAGSTPDGAVAFDTTGLPNGAHVLTAVVTRRDGRVEVTSATFEVHNVAAKVALVALGAHPEPSRSWPDSLMASYYGSALGAPVLLVAPGEVPEATFGALDGVVAATVIGGPAAVSDEVFADLDAVVEEVDRVWGQDRFDTAVQVTRRLVSADLVATDEVWVATGRNWPDAATAGPTVYGHGAVLVLIDGDGSRGDGAALDWLQARREAIGAGVVIGGPAAVTDDAVTAFRLAIT